MVNFEEHARANASVGEPLEERLRDYKQWLRDTIDAMYYDPQASEWGHYRAGQLSGLEKAWFELTQRWLA